MSQVTGNRVARSTSAGAVEVRFAFIGVAGEKLSDGIVAGDAGAVLRLVGAGMQEGYDIGDLGFLQRREAGHAFVNPAIPYDGNQQIAVLIVAHDRGADQVGGPVTGGVFTMAEAATGLELRLPALDGGQLFRSG